MKKLKSSRPRDPLSELPKSLIFRIFWLLPMRDVVKTTILSKHWKNLWTTSPCLNFKYDDTYDNLDAFRDFTNRALICWEGIRIQKFKIDIRSLCTEESYIGDYEFWVYFAMRKKVQELYLHNSCFVDAYSSVPHDLYSYSSLEVLSLVQLSLEKCRNVQWNQLKSLTIDDVEISEDVINQILYGSPQLEVFSLTLLEDTENLSIRSNSLKRLSIYSGASFNRELRISAPNLETLKIWGVPCKYFLRDVSSLTHVTLEFHCRKEPFVEEGHPHREAEGHPHREAEGHPYREAVRQILSTIRHVEKVTLSGYCIKMLVAMNKKGLLPSSSNVKLLILNNGYLEYGQIVGVLEIFPQLKMVVLKGDMLYIPRRQYARASPEFDANLPESFLQHLKTIEVTWAGVDHLIFPFIKIVLKYASKLEKMVIRVAPHKQKMVFRDGPPAQLVLENERPSNFLFLASQKLLRMPRSSPTAELIFCEC